MTGQQSDLPSRAPHHPSLAAKPTGNASIVGLFEASSCRSDMNRTPVSMQSPRHLPLFATVEHAYARLWRYRWLHIKAIWPPVVFLVAAEFLFHKVVGNSEGLSGKWHAVLAAPWYAVGGAALAWLAGLKFLLSFSISWRRTLLLGDRFDPFYFKLPSWKYLGFLIVAYAWSLPVLAASLLLAKALSPARSPAAMTWAAIAPPVLAVALILWVIIRQVPYFTLLTLDPPHPGWRQSVGVMRGNALRYAVTWLAAMLPIIAANLLLDVAVQKSGVDVHLTSVALGESAFRQAMLFLHFSLGALMGALTTATLILGERPDGVSPASGRRIRNTP
ncbi:MAG: hypothetical protein JO209_01540 [Acidisphaera sp.]|nr:hypothetical protein [Acidisphaera sp.]